MSVRAEPRHHALMRVRAEPRQHAVRAPAHSTATPRLVRRLEPPPMCA
eukprot:gene37894-37892_t